MSIESFDCRRYYIECRLQVIMLPKNRNDMLLGNNDIICMTDIVFLRYMSEGIIHSGMLTVEFESSSSLCSINYLDVQYSDPEMTKLNLLNFHLVNEQVELMHKFFING